MKTIKTKEPKLAPKSDVSKMRENAAKIEAGRASLAEQKKVEKKAKIKGALKKYGRPAAIAVGSALVGGMTQAISKKHPSKNYR